MKFSGVGNRPINKLLKFGGDPDRDMGKTCLGRDMHCPSASSYYYCFTAIIQVNLRYPAHPVENLRVLLQ